MYKMSYSDSLKYLIKSRDVLKNSVIRMLTFLNENTDVDIYQLSLRKLKLEKTYEKFEKIQFDLELLAEKEGVQDLHHEDQRANCEEQYFECMALINKRMQEFNLSSLPINVPKTKIDNLERDTVIVHNTMHQTNNMLAKVTKTSVLEECNNHRQAVNTHLKALFELPRCDYGQCLFSFLSKITIHVNALKELNQPTDNWDALLVYMILEKIDPFMKSKWESTLNGNDIPTFKELMNFLFRTASEAEINASLAKPKKSLFLDYINKNYD